tara:strand:- start:47805 stop:48017 length:213 start_codon:yes stop_codon:yes gene_type:complete
MKKFPVKKAIIAGTLIIGGVGLAAFLLTKGKGSTADEIDQAVEDANAEDIQATDDNQVEASTDDSAEQAA